MTAQPRPPGDGPPGDGGPGDSGPGDAEPGDASARTRFGPALRNREFRALWFADAVSAVGTQVSRVALSLLVYGRTGSALASAAVFALTFLPTLLGGALLSGLADRLPRRGLMIGTDLARAVLVAGMALPFVSVGLILALVFCSVLLEAPFRAAQTATLPLVLADDEYEAGMALRAMTLQGAQLLGYAAGGLLVAAAGPRLGLAVDALTFAAGALVVAVRVRPRPVPGRERRHDNAVRDYLRSTADGAATVARSPRLRVFVGLALLAGVYVVPEGLAAPYADSIGAGDAAVGLLMACDAAGSALGSWLLIRLVPESWRYRSMALVAAAPGLILLAMLLRPGLAWTIAVWTLAGAFSVFQIPASVAFVRAVPDAERGQAMGLVISGMLTAQGVGVLLGGVVAEFAGTADAIATFGALGVVSGLGLAVSWSRIRRADARAGGASTPARGGG